jgi:hypothetical protein
MLEKKEIINSVTVLESGQLQVQKAIVILEDDIELSRTYHRHVIDPGTDYSNEETVVQNIAAVVHTPEVIAAFEGIINANWTDANGRVITEPKK